MLVSQFVLLMDRQLSVESRNSMGKEENSTLPTLQGAIGVGCSRCGQTWPANTYDSHDCLAILYERVKELEKRIAVNEARFEELVRHYLNTPIWRVL